MDWSMMNSRAFAPEANGFPLILLFSVRSSRQTGWIWEHSASFG